MNYLFKISFRNLTRQKKRNVFLGLSIAFGVMILVVATAFSSGISDVIFNRVVRYVAGQVSVAFYEKNMIWCQIFRDKNRMQQILKLDDASILEVDENVGIFSRAIGNGKGENVMLVGIDSGKSISEKSRLEIEQSFRMLEGAFQDLGNESVENPAILSTDKASELNVKKNDVIRIRYKNIFGQQQAARITVVGIMKITNVFMSGVIFLDLKNAKRLLGYQPWEMGSLSITLKDPKKDALRIADRLHGLLKPGLASLEADLLADGRRSSVRIMGFFNTDPAKQAIRDNVIATGLTDEDLGKKGVLITEQLARKYNLAKGEKIRISYNAQFNTHPIVNEYVITGIVQPKGCLANDVILLNEFLFYETYYNDLPANRRQELPPISDTLRAALATEWVLLPRTKTTEDFKKKMRHITAKNTKATVVDVATMYEIASDVIKLENALNIITLVAVLILFLIILIGVVNTLRMTIRERTREIGTMRALGMQKEDIRNIFMLETFFLTIFSSLIGIAMAFIVMWGIAQIHIDAQDNPLGMFLVDGRIFFLPTWQSIVANILMILVIALLTAFFPARRAANLKAAEAFRHYE